MWSQIPEHCSVGHRSTTGSDDYIHVSTKGRNSQRSTTGSNNHRSTIGCNNHRSTTGKDGHRSTTGIDGHSSTTYNQQE